MAHQLDDDIAARFDRIDVPSRSEKTVFLDANASTIAARCDLPVVKFHFGEICDKGYRPLRPRSIMPGSNHFPVIEFAVTHLEFDFVWALEFDVVYTGDWCDVLDCVDPSVDFVATHFRRFEEEPQWPWWNMVQSRPDGINRLPRSQLLASFNPIFRLSRRAAQFLKRQYIGGWIGHYEITMATLLKENGFRLEELGGDSAYTPPHRRGRFYRMNETFRWRPEFAPESLKGHPDTLFHPVKRPL
jgi:hypothetical protein